MTEIFNTNQCSKLSPLDFFLQAAKESLLMYCCLQSYAMSCWSFESENSLFGLTSNWKLSEKKMFVLFPRKRLSQCENATNKPVGFIFKKVFKCNSALKATCVWKSLLVYFYHKNFGEITLLIYCRTYGVESIFEAAREMLTKNDYILGIEIYISRAIALFLMATELCTLHPTCFVNLIC